MHRLWTFDGVLVPVAGSSYGARALSAACIAISSTHTHTYPENFKGISFYKNEHVHIAYTCEYIMRHIFFGTSDLTCKWNGSPWK